MKFEIMAKVERNGEEFIVPQFWVEAENALLARSYARQIVGKPSAISAIEVGSVGKMLFFEQQYSETRKPVLKTVPELAVWALENPGRHGELISNASR